MYPCRSATPSTATIVTKAMIPHVLTIVAPLVLAVVAVIRTALCFQCTWMTMLGIKLEMASQMTVA